MFFTMAATPGRSRRPSKMMKPHGAWPSMRPKTRHMGPQAAGFRRLAIFAILAMVARLHPVACWMSL